MLIFIRVIFVLICGGIGVWTSRVLGTGSMHTAIGLGAGMAFALICLFIDFFSFKKFSSQIPSIVLGFILGCIIYLVI